jgi:hypothetical protein
LNLEVTGARLERQQQPGLQCELKDMPRIRRSVAVLCLAIAVFATVLPGIVGHFTAILIPLWLVVPTLSLVRARRNACQCDEQSVSLLSLDLSRGPPASLALA